MTSNNHIVTLFGGTGDLTYRKLLPAFYNLYYRGDLPDSFHIVIVGRRDFTTKSYIDNLKDWLKEHTRFPFDEVKFNEFTQYIHYFKMVFTEKEGYQRLRNFYDTLNKDIKHDLLYYLAVDPGFFITIGNNLHEHGLSKDANIIIEKPFGNDLKSAVEINEHLQDYFGESHIYRIDHYTAKEMVQNIHTIRFGNSIFDKSWHKDMIDNITISASETVGVVERGNFYDVTGALKDMVQSHLLQILSIVLMDEPDERNADSIHDKQEAILENLKIRNYQKDIIYGQYESYKTESDVDANSKTETYVALRVEVDLPRWEGVPIFIQTGKKMAKRSTEITVQFKAKGDLPPNLLVIKVQPDEGVYFKLNIKTPGNTNHVETVFMDFCQSCNLEYRKNTPEAYERLLEYAMQHDRTLFASFKQVRSSWKFIEDIIDNTKDNPLYVYKDETQPVESVSLLKEEQTSWFDDVLYGETFEH